MNKMKTVAVTVLAAVGLSFVANAWEQSDAPKQSDLPAGYTLAKYVIAKGNEYISTGIKMQDQIGLDVQLMPIEIGSGGNYVLGAYSSSSLCEHVLNVYGTSWRGKMSNESSFHYYDGIPSAGVLVKAHIRTVISGKTQMIEVDGVTASKSCSKDQSSSDKELSLLANATGTTNPFIGYLYYAKIYTGATDLETGTLARNYIPCRRDSDGVYGLYETVEGEFKVPDKSGYAFDGKVPTANLPSQYGEVEYVECPWTAADTGLTWQDQLAIDVQFSWKSLNGTGTKASNVAGGGVFGAGSTYRSFAYSNTAKTWLGGGTSFDKGTAAENAYYSIYEYLDDVKFTFSLNGAVAVTKTAASSQQGNVKTYGDACYLGNAFTENDGYTRDTVIFSAKIYTDKTTLARDYIPVYNYETEQYGFYDLLESGFITSANDTPFKGPTPPPRKSGVSITSSSDEVAGVDPEYGVHDSYELGETVSCSAPELVTVQTGVRYACKGWKLYDAAKKEIDTGDGVECEFKYDQPLTLEWQWTKEYEVTVVADNGSVTGAGWYAEGEEVTLTATPAQGYMLTTWLGVTADFANPLVFTMGASPLAITAVFAASEEGHYTVSANTQEKHGADSLNPSYGQHSGTFADGQQITFTAPRYAIVEANVKRMKCIGYKVIPEEGAASEIIPVESIDDMVSTTVEYSGPFTLEWQWVEELYGKVTREHAGDWAENDGWFCVGEKYTFTIGQSETLKDNEQRAVYTGYQLVSNEVVIGEGEVRMVELTYEYPVTIRWVWYPEYAFYAVADNNSHGSVAVKDNDSINCWFAADDEITVTATAKPGYAFSHWCSDEIPEFGQKPDNPLTLKMPAMAAGVVAYFVKTIPVVATTKNGYLVSADGENWSTSLELNYEAGTEVTLYYGPSTTAKYTWEGLPDDAIIDETARKVTFTMPENELSLSLTGEDFINPDVGWYTTYKVGNKIYTAIAFTKVGEHTFTIPNKISAIDYLVVGGGGSGGTAWYGCGGGGGGGVATNITPYAVTPGSTLTITVGKGGASPTKAGAGTTGERSSIAIGETEIACALGGGGGAGGDASALADGANGGGGSSRDGYTDGGEGVAGYTGGKGVKSGQYGGGGAGAGRNGGDAKAVATNKAGNGGDGIASWITGEEVWYAGGGGGGRGDVSDSTYGDGGNGGGGRGGSASSSPNGVDGTDGLGGGGGGCGQSWNSSAGGKSNGGKGGDGVVIIRYVSYSLGLSIQLF